MERAEYAAMVHDLARLGWLQFGWLCDALLAGAVPRWTGDADRGREGVAEGPVELGEVALAGPVVVVVRHLRRDVAPQAVVERLADAATKRVAREPAPSVLVITNAPLTGTGRRALREELTGDPVGARADVLDGERLDALIAERPGLLRALPSLLGVRDPADPLARVFVPTRAYAAAVAALESHAFAVLTGPPEMGKTAIARMVALAQASDGWSAHECLEPAALHAAYDAGAAQVFVADDAFGSTEYRPDGAERWARALPGILPRLDARHWLVWTSRPAPLRAGLARLRREPGMERGPLPGEVAVDAGALDPDERALILLRHAQAAGLPASARELVRRHGLALVEHPHFTPERIRRLVASLPGSGLVSSLGGEEAIRAAVQAALETPTEAMRTAFAALGDEHRALLHAMLDRPPGPVPERALAAGLRALLPGAHGDPHRLLAALGEQVVRPHHGRIEWVHPGWRDVAIEDLAGRPGERRAFLRACGLDGLALALSARGGAAGRRALPLLREDADWDALGDRLGPLLRELDDDGMERLLGLLEEAAGRVEDPELEALARRALVLAARAWSGGLVPVAGLAAWWGLARRFPPPPEPPDPGRTWAQLEPAALPRDGAPEALDELEAWLGLAEILLEHRPAQLAVLGFPGRHLGLLEAAARELPGPPAQSARIRAAARRLLGDPRPPVEPDVEEEEEEVAPGPPGTPAPLFAEVARVERILADLGYAQRRAWWTAWRTE